MDDFTVTVAEREPGVVIEVCGELDLATAEGLWVRVAPLLLPGSLVVLDAAGMPFMDSSGLRVLLQAARRAAETGATFRVVAPPGTVERVIRVAGVEGQLAVRDSVAAALDG